MSRRPCFFVVALDYVGRPQPALYWDELPRTPIRRMVYVQRLDLFPNADKLMSASLEQLFETYQRLKRRGKLPPRWEPPKPEKGGAAPAEVGT
jgi:hypothetical protein